MSIESLIFRLSNKVLDCDERIEICRDLLSSTLDQIGKLGYKVIIFGRDDHIALNADHAEGIDIIPL